MTNLWKTPTLLAAIAVSSSATARDDYAKFNDPFRVCIGGFWPRINSEIGINGDVLPPVPPLDVDDFLGV